MDMQLTSDENNEEDKAFNYASHVDLHMLFSSGEKSSIRNAVAIGTEHNFRGIIVLPNKIQELSEEIKKNANSELLPIAMIDYPFGASTLDVRNYNIISAKEKGTKEVEIIAPYHFLAEKNFAAFEHDMKATTMTAAKHQIKIKYVIDLSVKFFKEDILSRIARIANSCGVFLSTSTGFFDDKINHSNLILKIRAIKNKADVRIKSYINTDNIEIISSYNKAGIEVMGLDIKNAPKLVHEFESQIK